jgi:DNA-binding MarR family transcriptional regulator
MKRASPASRVSSARRVASTGAGETLFQFVRLWSRRGHDPVDLQRGRDVLVAEAVHALRDRPEVTVNDVAVELGLDQSGASRMVTRAAEQGYLATQPSSADARRRTIEVTRHGTALLAAAHAWQDSVFAELTEDWTEAERASFHRAMLRLMDRSRQLAASVHSG